MRRMYRRAAEELRGNPGQWAAFESSGSCVVLAGPGSGKTKTLTLKMARMLAEDIQPPRGMACITYSNECARELRRRLHALGIQEIDNVFIGTVHSFCLKHVVAPYARLAGIALPEPIRVATQKEQQQAFERALSEVMGESAKAYQFRVPIEAYRRTHIDRTSPSWNEYLDFAAVVTNFEARLRKSGLIDFEDMVLIGRQIVESQEWVRRALKAKFPILVIDEYQDLGLPLHRIVLSLCFPVGIRLFAVGDRDQSIYGFTGAQPELLQELSERSEVISVTLPFNYRSAAEIVAAGEVVLGESRGYSATSKGKGLVEFHFYENGLEEQAHAIINDLLPAAMERDKTRTLGNIAVLYIDRHDGDLISSVAMKAGIQFVRIDNGAPIPSTPLVRWLEDCATWCAGGWQTSKPRLQDIIRRWLALNTSLGQISERRASRSRIIRFMLANRDSNQKLHSWLASFVADCLQEALEKEGTLREETQNVDTLRKLTEKGGDLENATVATFSGQAGSPGHLNFVTLHSAKGLEYDVVFLMGMDQGRLPSWGDDTPQKLAEARRRFYVGVTRAKREVHLTYSGFTTDRYGRIHDNGPSPLLLELSKKLATS